MLRRIYAFLAARCWRLALLCLLTCLALAENVLCWALLKWVLSEPKGALWAAVVMQAATRPRVMSKLFMVVFLSLKKRPMD